MVFLLQEVPTGFSSLWGLSPAFLEKKNGRLPARQHSVSQILSSTVCGMLLRRKKKIFKYYCNEVQNKMIFFLLQTLSFFLHCLLTQTEEGGKFFSFPLPFCHVPARSLPPLIPAPILSLAIPITNSYRTEVFPPSICPIFFFFLLLLSPLFCVSAWSDKGNY